ncbi:MAG: type IV pilus twitching motility protein PilT [Chloroflexi bacterium]|nr:type IV pilus twitching motility protein PilT [Chloroflexota bacterium]
MVERAIEEEQVTPSGRVHIDELLYRMARLGASDIHLKAGLPPVLRIHGQLVPQEVYEPLDVADMERLFGQISSPGQRARFQEQKELDIPYEVEGLARFRVNVAWQRGSVSIVMRRLTTKIPSIDSLGLPAVCKELVMKPRGLILVTGPTGSGKSTTLASMIDYLNERDGRRVITIEDPIEYVFQDKKCLITQREVGEDTPSFASALKHALRQDPDVILVGEMRDLETISAALTAAETGHLVLSTLHTAGAALTVDRIIDVFPPHQQQQVRTQLASILEGVLSQTLLPTIDGNGRVAAVEVLVATAAIRNMIREGKTHQLPGVIETSQRVGMQTLDQALLALVERGQVSPQDALAKAANADYLRARLSELPAIRQRARGR